MTKLMLLVQQQRLTQHGRSFFGPVSLSDGGHQQQLCAGRHRAPGSPLLLAPESRSAAVFCSARKRWHFPQYGLGDSHPA